MKRKNFLESSLLAGISIMALPAYAFPLQFSDKTEETLEPFYIPPSREPLKEQPSGVDFRLKVRSKQTNNQYSCMETLIGPKVMGPAPHLHKDLDEIMFVQEGTVSVLVGNKIYHVQAGGWHMRPREIVHTFWNETDKPARFIDMYFNQDFDNFLEEMFVKLVPDLMKRGISFTSKEATDKMNLLYVHYGITMFDEQRQPIIDKYGLKG